MTDAYGRAQLFVDVAYIREDLKQLGISPWFGPRELIRPLVNRSIAEKLSISRTIFYDAVDSLAATAGEHEAYLDAIGRLPDTLVRLGTVIGARKRQKTVDMQIGLDMVQAGQSGLVGHVILASGDADFIPAVQKVQDLGPKGLVLAFQSSVSNDLVREADRFIPLPTNSDRAWAIDKL